MPRHVNTGPIFSNKPGGFESRLLLHYPVVSSSLEPLHPPRNPPFSTASSEALRVGYFLISTRNPYTHLAILLFLSHASCSGGFECRLLLDHRLIFLDELTHPSTCLATLHFSSSFLAGGFECRLLHLMTCKFSCNSELQHHLPHNPPFELRHVVKPPIEPSPQKHFMIPLLWS